jgi:hypothetical protein
MSLFHSVESSARKRAIVVASTLAIFGALAFASNAIAGSSTGGVITSIYTNTDFGQITIVTNGTRSGQPSCATSPNWILAMTTANAQVYAQLLTAFATQSTVNFTGDGLCNVNSSAETLVQVQILN